MGHVFNLSLTVAKALNLSLALDRTFEYEHGIINVMVHRGGVMGRFRKRSSLHVLNLISAERGDSYEIL